MNIWIIRFENEHNRELTGLRGSVRIFARTQIEAERKADSVLNTWLEENPGEVGSWTVTKWSEPRYRYEN